MITRSQRDRVEVVSVKIVLVQSGKLMGEIGREEGKCTGRIHSLLARSKFRRTK